MDESIAPVFEYIDSNQDRAVETLKTLVKYPSVSAKGDGIGECAQHVKRLLEDLGVESKLLDIGKGCPVVYGEVKSKRNPKKTVLFYNHYDVQPPEPLELWESPPFEPREKNGKIFGRGVADDKAELVGRLKLTEAFLETRNDVPCNFKFLIEGEEEIGSAHLHEYAKKYPDFFKADGVVWEFGGVDSKERPLVTLGVKGILYVELVSRNAKRDAHSSVAAVVENPAWRLVWALNSMKRNEKILIPGWYENVRPFTKEELRLIRKQPTEEKAQKEELGIKKFIGGMRGIEVRKALAGKPTCTICGLFSGYIGPGSKTVLPKEAIAKVDFRLVPDQDPADLLRKLKSHLESEGFSDVEITFAELEKPARTSPDEPIAKAAAIAAEKVHNKKPVIMVSSAGTGPMFLFKAPCVAIGGGYPSSRAHAPNENTRIDLFMKGMKWVADTVNRFALL
jgi:acetylornithine deacetylase/succinyl-diaminopimelate desuccinylase-like protein